MPTYAYACTACDHRFDAAHGFHDEPLSICPECGGPVRKVYGSVGVTFKGSGFYRTDSRSSSTGKGSSSSSVAASAASSTSSDGGSSSGSSSNGSSSSGSSSSGSSASSGAAASAGSAAPAAP